MPIAGNCERIELIKLGEVVSKVDQWIFYWKEKSKLKGITIFFFRLPNLERKKKL